MSAVLREERRLRPMKIGALGAVLAIEDAAYAFPWTRGNFIDSLAAGYWAQTLVGAGSELFGYVIALPGVEEMHLLNLTVAPAHQGCGHGRYLLDALVAHCREQGAAQLWLEVRASNQRGRHVYARYGFRDIGVRKGYYPAAAQGREDAVVMSLMVQGKPHALE